MNNLSKKLQKTYTNVITMYPRFTVNTLIIITVLLSACGKPENTTPETSTLNLSVTADTALTKAASLYKKRADLDKAREAIKTLGKARNPDQRNFNVEWKFARYSYFLGNRDEVSDNERSKILKKGLLAAKIAYRLEPKKAEGHFWYGAILGEQSRRSPLTVGIVSIDKIRSALEKSLDIDPKFQNASAYVGLGQLELSTLGIAGGNSNKAVEYLEKGLELEKSNGFLYLRLAEAYLAVKRRADAKKHLDHLLKMDAHPDYIPEHAEAVKEAKKILKTKF